ncbi:hypothetical protein K435DRAFT_969351 [Dendrothele bispora CBS 962.96]|uniref:Uncharacterized protein n=1 Tax=Dendrothele bispora (strain CBS 962.96) TaxID=1314807 RepID=A0A4S8LJH1_DENBC|nr:hypothetical protein K435DRAFT_969351 [Dendrothele bispora CBS 962.96]
MEVEYLWKRPVSSLTCLFFFNRYFSLTGTSIVTISLFSSNLSPSSCGAFHIFREILLVVTEVIVCVLLTVRVYAIYNQNKRIFMYMTLAGLVLAGLALFALFFGSSSTSSVSLTPLGCHTNLDFLPDAAQEAASWEALFLYDTLLFVMLVLKGYEVWRSSRLRVPILNIVLRDGASYFAVMALANLANIFTFYFAGPYTRGGLSTFSSAISVTMMSRLTFNLHANAQSTKNVWSTNQSTVLSTLPSTLPSSYQSTSWQIASSSMNPSENRVERGKGKMKSLQRHTDEPIVVDEERQDDIPMHILRNS